jgi:NAD(P)H dehydrogenase (quinone)
MSKIAVIYYSSTGHVHTLADALANGAADAGAEVRLRRVAELAPEEIIRREAAWDEHYAATVDVVDEAQVEDLEWADGFALGTPMRYGLPTAQLKEFIDQTGPLWADGHMANKVATSFTSAANRHGGQESTLLALNYIFYHRGSLIVPPGCTNQVQYEAGGNPYGTSYESCLAGGLSVSVEALTAAHYQGLRLAHYASRLVSRAASVAAHPDGAELDPVGLASHDPPHLSAFG